MFSKDAFGVLTVIDEFTEVFKRTVIAADQFTERSCVCTMLIIVFLNSPLSTAKLVVNLPGNLYVFVLRSTGVKNGKCICFCRFRDPL